MNREARDRVFTIIAKTKHIGVETVTIDKTFEELEIDSLDAVQIIYAVEEEFKIAIDDDQVTSLRSIRGVIEGIETLLAEKTVS